MRYRTKGLITVKKVEGFYQAYRANGTLYGALVPFVCNIPNGKIESILDDDSKRRGKRKFYRPCTHTTVDVRSGMFTIGGFNSPSPGSNYWVLHSGGIDASPLDIPVLPASVHHEALAFFASGCVDRYFDLGVNLMEIKQLGSLARQVKSIFTGELFKAFAKKPIKEIANSHLSYSFGIKPLISDIEGAIKAISKFEEKIAWLRKNQGKPVRVSFKKDLSQVISPALGMTYSDSDERNYTLLKQNKAVYRSTAIITYDTSRLSDLELKCRTFARMAGMDSLLRVGYELIPFSFVLDWALRVGDWIESIDPTVHLKYKVQDIGWSISLIQDIEMIKQSLYPRGTSKGVYGSSRKTLFHRRPGLPISYSTVDLGDPGVSQLALGLSLAVQKLHR